MTLEDKIGSAFSVHEEELRHHIHRIIDKSTRPIVQAAVEAEVVKHHAYIRTVVHAQIERVVAETVERCVRLNEDIFKERYAKEALKSALQSHFSKFKVEVNFLPTE